MLYVRMYPLFFLCLCFERIQNQFSVFPDLSLCVCINNRAEMSKYCSVGANWIKPIKTGVMFIF